MGRKAEQAVVLSEISPKARRLIAEHKADPSLSERHKALLEQSIWSALHPDDRRKHNRDSFFKAVLGCSTNETTERSCMLGYGADAEVLWQRIEQKDSPMLLSTAARLYREARKRISQYPDLRLSMSDTLQVTLAVYDALPVGAIRKSDGKTFRRKKQSSMPTFDEAQLLKLVSGRRNKTNGAGTTNQTKLFWDIVRNATSSYLVSRLDGADPSVAEQLYQEFEIELKALMDGFSARVHIQRDVAKEQRQRSDRTVRKHLKEALSIFGMDIPRKGKPFDLLLLKKRYRKAAATYHPDKHPPDSREVMQDKFYAVTRSYEQVLVWHKDTYENTGENAHG